jgi:hypothetical protein
MARVVQKPRVTTGRDLHKIKKGIPARKKPASSSKLRARAKQTAAKVAKKPQEVKPKNLAPLKDKAPKE